MRSFGQNSLSVANTSDDTVTRIAQIRTQYNASADNTANDPDNTADETDNTTDNPDYDPGDTTDNPYDTAHDLHVAKCVPAVVGNWVVVFYDDVKYPGKVTGVFDNDVEVSCIRLPRWKLTNKARYNLV